MSVVRKALGRSAADLPWMVPMIQPFGYGSAAGHDLVRRAWVDIANLPGNPYGVFIVSRNNGDTDINYGVKNFGDAHMNEADCKQMAVRDGLIIARIFQQRHYTDGLNIAAPSVGPSIVSAQKVNSNTVRVTVKQDTGTDFTIGPDAALGLGWKVQDGGKNDIAARACTRISPTTLQVALASPMTSASPTITYAAGGGRLAVGDTSGHGNAVYDNAAWPGNPWSAFLPLPLGLSVYPTRISDQP